MFDRYAAERENEVRVWLWPHLLILALILSGIVVAFEAVAQNPITHARRLSAAAVWLDLAVPVTDACTQMDAVIAGAPSGQKPPRDAHPLIVTVRQPPPAVSEVRTTQRCGQEIFVPAGVYVLHLYIVDGEQKVIATERVRIGA